MKNNASILFVLSWMLLCFSCKGIKEVSRIKEVHTGHYKAIRYKHQVNDSVELFISDNGTFSRSDYRNEQHFGRQRFWINGTWRSNSDTIVFENIHRYLTDVPLDTFRKYGKSMDTLQAATYLIADNRLKFLSCKIKNINTFPDFYLVDSTKQVRSKD